MKKIFDLFSYFDINDYYESHNLLISCCPVHEGDNETAFNINIDEDHEEHHGRWFCNTKGCHNNKPGKDIISLTWMLLEKKFDREFSFGDVLRFAEKFCKGIRVNENISTHRPDAFTKLLKRPKREITEGKFTRNAVRQNLIFPAQYYLNRGFLEETLDAFDVGLCMRQGSKMYQRIVFPVYDEADKYMVGCVGRTVVDNPRKWINQEGFSKSNFLYNYGKAIEHIRRTDTIILVEGQGDVMRLWEAGIKNAVGMFGSKVSDSQEFLIQRTGVSNIVVIADNDDAGHACAKDVVERLQFLFNVYAVNPPKNDIGDMTVSEIDSIIKPKIQGKF